MQKIKYLKRPDIVYLPYFIRSLYIICNSLEHSYLHVHLLKVFYMYTACVANAPLSGYSASPNGTLQVKTPADSLCNYALVSYAPYTKFTVECTETTSLGVVVIFFLSFYKFKTYYL